MGGGKFACHLFSYYYETLTYEKTDSSARCSSDYLHNLLC